MKAKVRIIALILSVSICVTAWADADAMDLLVDSLDQRPMELTFGQYYKPYEQNIEPNTPGYTLPLDINDIVNYEKVSSLLRLTNAQHLILQNGFAVTEWRCNPFLEYLTHNIVAAYKDLTILQIPFFVTTDTLLHLYHLQFDETLRDIEERLFIPDINNLTIALLNDALQQYDQLGGNLKEAARRNTAYLSVAKKLINPNASTPVLVDGIVVGEIAKIKAHSGFSLNTIFMYMEDYSQYVPRGHYTRSEALERYFKTMMWYGRMAFLLKGGPEAFVSEYDARIQTLQAFLLATSLRNVHIDERTGLDIWDRLYTVTAFYVGIADDLTPYDYLWALDHVFDNNFTVSDLAEKDNILALKTELALLPSPQIYGGTGNIVLDWPVTTESLNEVLEKTKGMRLIGQRFIPDSYMFQHLVFSEVGGYLGDLQSLPFTVGNDGAGGLCRAYVRGLDVMALLGSNEALKILIDEGDTDYLYFWQQFGKLKDEFDTLSKTDWNANLYWSWLYTLKSLLEELPEGYPNFMRTIAWQKHQLHTALASWTQLRHDTILYAKQGYPSTSGGGPLDIPPGYVEPLPEFWGRLLSLTRMTSRGLDDLNVLSPENRQQLGKLDELLMRILDIVGKQLTNKQLSSEDNKFIKSIPTTLDSIVTDVENEGLKTTLAVDVHTHPVEAKVVEEAVGKVDLIVVACPAQDGSVFLVVGPVLSYYEFKHPMSDRLTDEAWRTLLDSPNKPERPEWYSPLMR